MEEQTQHAETPLPPVVNIFMAFDDAYACHAAVTIASILRNTTQGVRILVLSTDLSAKSMRNLRSMRYIRHYYIDFLEVDRNRFAKITPTVPRIPLEACYRLMIPDIWKDVTKGIYLDADLIVRTNIACLQGEDVSGVLAGVVDDLMPEQKIRFPIKRYFNSGVLLLNLKEIRKQFTLSKFMEIEEDNHQNIQYQDQDILNIGFEGRVRFLDRRWNVTTLSYMELVGHHRAFASEIIAARNDPKIFHFVGPWKPWVDLASDCPTKLIAEYFKYLIWTPYANERYRIFVRYCLCEPFRACMRVLRGIKHGKININIRTLPLLTKKAVVRVFEKIRRLFELNVEIGRHLRRERPLLRKHRREENKWLVHPDCLRR
jgi:lipopolysaccharide biosynthesis glycosyltransferase